MRRLDIQGLRALAVLVVVAQHAGAPLPGGFVGVDIFFVVSGFVITSTLLREHSSTSQIKLWHFYRRRFWRLFPALSFVVSFTLICGLVTLSIFGTVEVTVKTAVGAVLLSSNLVIAKTTGGYFDDPASFNPLLQTWSLSVEEQFYLIFPLVTLLGLSLDRGKRSSRSLSLLITLIIVVSVASVFSLNRWNFPGQELLFGFYSPLTRAWEFGVGALIACTFNNFRHLSRTCREAFSFIGLAMIGSSLVVISETKQFPGTWTLLPVVGSALLLITGGYEKTLVSRLLSLSLMAKIGDRSYAIYLWHWPFIVSSHNLFPESQLAPFFAAGASVVAAAVSFAVVEQPLRVRSSVSGQSQIALAVLLVAIPVCSAISIWGANQLNWGSSQLGEFRKQVSTPHIMSSRNCVPSVVIKEPSRCIFFGDDRGTPIYLVGDSTADALSEAIYAVGEALQRPVGMVNLPGCPFKDVFIEAPDAPFVRNTEGCRSGYEKSLEWLLQRPRGVVIISDLNNLYRETLTKIGLTQESLGAAPDSRAEILDAGLISTIQTLKSEGFEVVLALAPPDFRVGKGIDPITCSLPRYFGGACVGSVSRVATDHFQKVERGKLAHIALESGASLYDPRDALCTAIRCDALSIDGVPLYRDSFHLSPAGSMILVPSLLQLLSGY